MFESFGGDINSAFVPYKTQYNKIIPISNDQALKYNLIMEGRNTYDNILLCWVDFDPKNFDLSYLDQILMLNLYSYHRICEDPYLEDVIHDNKKLTDIAKTLKSKKYRNELLEEYNIVKSVYMKYNTL